MYKKSILSVAIASSLMLTGCFDSSREDSDGANAGDLTAAPVTSTSGNAYPAFSPAVSDLSIPNDLIFDSVASDGTFLVPDSSPPVTTALNQLSGASTVAPIDIKILSGEIDDASLAGNVYLLELAYASGSPLQGLSIGEPPTVAGAANVALEHIVLDGNSYIRINPKTPLKPNTRYEVVITNGVKDTLGQPLVRNPGVASYAALSDLSIPLANPALAPVQTLINSLWEPTALAFFNLAVNPVREANNLEPLGDSNIVLSYTFTTSGDEKVLNYIADPAQWSPAGPFGSLLPTPAATTVTFDDAGVLDINEVSSLTASLEIPSGTVSVVQGEMTIPYYAGIPSGSNGAPLITDSWEADDTLATAINAAFAPLGLQIPQADPLVTTAVNYIFPFPKKKDDITIPVLGIHPTNPAGTMKSVMYQHGITTDRSAALAFGASMVAGAKSKGVDVAVIAIDQPLHGVDGISETEQKGLAETLLTSGGALTTPDGVFDGSDADEQATINGVVAGQFAYGIVQQVDTPCPFIDADRDGIVQATQDVLDGSCNGIGLAAVLGEEPSIVVKGAQVLERTVANGASTIPGLNRVTGVDERHFGFTSAGAGVAPNAMDYTGSSAANSSGSLFINLTSFLTSRDNVRQQVLDLLAVRKSLGTVDVNGAAANGEMSDSDVYFIGHSLGTINGLPFVAVANDSTTATDNIVAANMLTPGSGITRLLENSPTFSTPILGGLANLGLTQETSSFQTYMNVLQATLDSGDPANFVADLGSTEQNTPVLFTLVVGDTTISNSVDSESEVLGDGSIAYMSGSEPLADLISAAALAATDQNDPVSPVALGQREVRFNSEGGKVTHGTPVFPSSGTAEEIAAFAEMVGQATSIVLSGGAGVQVTNGNVIE